MKKYVKVYFGLVLIYAVVLVLFYLNGTEVPKGIDSVYSLLQVIVVVCALSGGKKKGVQTKAA